jgi:hypothetical protein
MADERPTGPSPETKPGGDTGASSPAYLRRIEQARQQRAGVRAASDRLERAVASPASERTKEWCSVFSARLSDLGTAFRHHVEVTEAHDGLFAEIIETAPRLAHRTEELRQDHREIEAAIDEAVVKLAPTANPDHTSVDNACDAALDLFTRISHHRHLGAELVYDAYHIDIEAAD